MASEKDNTRETEKVSEKETGEAPEKKSETRGPSGLAGAPVEELLGRSNLDEEADAGFV
jgi:hypothetical protein